MIFDSVKNLNRYAALAPEVWAKIEAFTRSVTPATPKGRQKLDGDMLMADVNSYNAKPLADGRYENHRRYVDLQLMLEGAETVYLTDVEGLELVEDKYAEKDCAFYRYTAGTGYALPFKAGEFAIFYPGEAHLPGRGDDNAALRKIVFKIDASLLGK